MSSPERDPGTKCARARASSIPHRPNLCFELRVAFQAELPAALTTFPGPGFVFLLRKDDDPADFFPGDAMQRDRDELAPRGHGGSLENQPQFPQGPVDYLRGKSDAYQQHATGRV